MNDEHFLNLAETISIRSKDPSRKIGAALVDPHNKRVLSTGFNGFPRGIADTQERLDDRQTKYRFVVHAEMNAIFNAAAAREAIQRSTMYITGLPPCSECAKGIIQCGISRVVIRLNGTVPENWEESWKFTQDLFKEAGIVWEILP